MLWWHIVVGALLYFIFKDKILGKIKEIQKWLILNEETIEKWKDNAEIMAAYEATKRAWEKADLDKKWDVVEIIQVLSLAINLLNLIKRAIEEGEGNG